MKKSGILAAALSAILLTACSNGSASSTQAESSASSALESSVNSTSSSAAEVSSGSTQGSSGETPTVTDKKADLYAEAALNAVEFPKMTKVEAADEIDALFEFNTENYADFSLYMNVMSVNLNRVIIVKPADGKHDDVFAELKAYYDDLIENGAFYPAQESAAAGARIGETADGYIYIIVHEDSETAVRAIEDAVSN